MYKGLCFQNMFLVRHLNIATMVYLDSPVLQSSFEEVGILSSTCTALMSLSGVLRTNGESFRSSQLAFLALILFPFPVSLEAGTSGPFCPRAFYKFVSTASPCPELFCKEMLPSTHQAKVSFTLSLGSL